MPSRNEHWKTRHRAEIAEKRERAKTCTHEGRGTRSGPGCVGGTWRIWCAYCDTLLHDTLWEWRDES